MKGSFVRISGDALAFALLSFLCLSSFAQTKAVTSSPNPYDARFQAIRSQFVTAQHDSSRAVLLNSAFQLRTFLDRREMPAWLRSVQSDTGQSDLIRTEAARLLRDDARAAGETDLPSIPPAPEILRRARAEAANGLRQALHSAGALEFALHAPEARTNLERYATLTPTAEAWVEFSRACADQLCRFSALRKALQLDPEDREALLELADYYRQRNQQEQESGLLARVLGMYPTDFVARKWHADLLLEQGQNEAALREFEMLEQQFPTMPWVQREVAAGYERLQLPARALPLAVSALAVNRTGAAERALVIRLAQRMHDTARLRSTYEMIVRLDPADALSTVELARIRVRSGEPAAARELLRAAIARGAQTEAGNQELLAAAAELDVSAGFSDEGISRSAASDALGNDARRLVNWRRTQTSAQDPDAAFLAGPNQIVAQAIAASVKGPETTEVLSETRIDRVAPNGSTTTRVQQFWLAGNAGAAVELLTRGIHYSPESESLEVLHARLHKSDGRVLEAQDAGEEPVADRRIAMYYDQRSRQLRFPGCEAGDIVEMDYRISPLPASNPYGDYFASLNVFRENLPVRHKRYVLIAPAARELHIVEERMPTPALVRLVGNSRVYQWDCSELPAASSEPHGPALTESAPYVHVSSIADWSEFGRWYAALLNPELALDEPLRQAVARISADHAGEIDRISAVHQFVLRNTHYVALEFGVHSYTPYPVSQVYARRFGDCKDKASLIIAMLRQMGIEADFTLVRTRPLGDISSRATSVALFNHAIVYVPKYGMWIDGTAEYSAPNELPLDDQGAMALTIGADGAAQLTRIPVSTAAQNTETDTIRASILQDGALRFSGTATARGENAPALRRRFQEAEQQRESLRKVYAEVFPAIRMDEVRVQGVKDFKSDVVVDFQGSLGSFTGRRELSLPASWSRADFAQQLAELPRRTQELVFAAPWRRTEEIRVTLPANAHVLDVPRAREQVAPFGSLTVGYEQNGPELIIRSCVQLTATRILPAEYAQFRSFWEEVDRALRQEVKVALQ